MAKHDNPIFSPDPSIGYDSYKVTSPHLLFREEWYYLFYVLQIQRSPSPFLHVCFSPPIWAVVDVVDVDHATVNIARLRDGLTGQEANVENPIFAPDPEPDSWNCDATYKLFALYDETSRQ